MIDVGGAIPSEHAMGKALTSARAIAVGGGKGGVGKSIIASNLAIALAKRNKRTVLVDVDLGAPNLHTLLGIGNPGKTLQSFFDKEVKRLDEVAIETHVPGLRLIAGVGAVPGAANIMHSRKLKLLRHIRMLNADAVVIDCGAGVTYNTLDFFLAADHRLLVATPQLTSLQNTYCFLKAAVYRSIKTLAEDRAEADLFTEASDKSETEHLKTLIERVKPERPAFAEAIATSLAYFGCSLIGNQAQDTRQHNVFHAVTRMMREFLDVEVNVLEVLSLSRKVHDSVNLREPLLSLAPEHKDAAALNRIARALLDVDVDELRDARQRASEKEESEEDAASKEERLPESLTPFLRGEERHSVNWKARLKHEGADFEVTVTDMSAKGAGLEGASALPQDAKVTLIIAQDGQEQELRGAVCYVKESEGRLGIQFADEESEAHAQQLLQKGT